MKATVSRGLAASVLVALCNDVRTAAVGEAWSDTNAIVLTWHLAGRGRMGALVPGQSRATHIPADRIPSAAIVLMQRPIEAERDGERSQLRAVARDARVDPGTGVTEKILQLVRAGEKVEAVGRYRTIPAGVGFVEARPLSTRSDRVR